MKKIIFLQSFVILILLFVFLTTVFKDSEQKIRIYVKTEEINTPLNRPTKQIMFLGNSITSHGICEYWWGNWGMAASFANKDYVHVLAKMISNKYNVKLYIINASAWEVNTHDRNKILEIMLPIISKKPDYIIIQMGENIVDTATLEKDFYSFIKFINSNAPKTKVVIIGNFDKNEKIDGIKDKVCAQTDTKFINLKSIQSADYKHKIGDIVYDMSGKEHIIEHEGVVWHPNDKGMEKIAKMIYDVL